MDIVSGLDKRSACLIRNVWLFRFWLYDGLPRPSKRGETDGLGRPSYKKTPMFASSSKNGQTKCIADNWDIGIITVYSPSAGLPQDQARRVTATDLSQYPWIMLLSPLSATFLHPPRGAMGVCRGGALL